MVEAVSNSGQVRANSSMTTAIERFSRAVAFLTRQELVDRTQSRHSIKKISGG